MSMNQRFRLFSRQAAATLGSSWAFLVAVLVILVWALTGPLFHFSDTWQLVINTGTTVVTFLMVFVIQNTQNRDAMAIQLKLDELLRAVSEARTGLVDLEDMSDQELAKLQAQFQELHDQVAGKEPLADENHGGDKEDRPNRELRGPND